MGERCVGIQKLHKLYRVRGVVYMDESEDVVNITEEIEPSKEDRKSTRLNSSHWW